MFLLVFLFSHKETCCPQHREKCSTFNLIKTKKTNNVITNFLHFCWLNNTILTYGTIFYLFTFREIKNQFQNLYSLYSSPLMSNSIQILQLYLVSSRHRVLLNEGKKIATDEIVKSYVSQREYIVICYIVTSRIYRRVWKF